MADIPINPGEAPALPAGIAPFFNGYHTISDWHDIRIATMTPTSSGLQRYADGDITYRHQELIICDFSGFLNNPDYPINSLLAVSIRLLDSSEATGYKLMSTPYRGGSRQGFLRRGDVQAAVQNGTPRIMLWVGSGSSSEVDYTVGSWFAVGDEPRARNIPAFPPIYDRQDNQRLYGYRYWVDESFFPDLVTSTFDPIIDEADYVSNGTVSTSLYHNNPARADALYDKISSAKVGEYLPFDPGQLSQTAFMYISEGFFHFLSSDNRPDLSYRCDAHWPVCGLSVSNMQKNYYTPPASAYSGYYMVIVRHPDDSGSGIIALRKPVASSSFQPSGIDYHHPKMDSYMKYQAVDRDTYLQIWQQRDDWVKARAEYRQFQLLTGEGVYLPEEPRTVLGTEEAFMHGTPKLLPPHIRCELGAVGADANGNLMLRATLKGTYEQDSVDTATSIAYMYPMQLDIDWSQIDLATYGDTDVYIYSYLGTTSISGTQASASWRNILLQRDGVTPVTYNDLFNSGETTFRMQLRSSGAVPWLLERMGDDSIGESFNAPVVSSREAYREYVEEQTVYEYELTLYNEWVAAGSPVITDPVEQQAVWDEFVESTTVTDSEFCKIEGVFTSIPDYDAAADVPFKLEYVNAILEYALYYSLSRDDENQGNLGRAVAHLNNFNQMVANDPDPREEQI